MTDEPRDDNGATPDPHPHEGENHGTVEEPCSCRPLVLRANGVQGQVIQAIDGEGATLCAVLDWTVQVPMNMVTGDEAHADLTAEALSSVMIPLEALDHIAQLMGELKVDVDKHLAGEDNAPVVTVGAVNPDHD